MRTVGKWVGILAVLATLALVESAWAGWGFGVSVGVPVYPRPCYRPYYRPVGVGVFVAPRPVILPPPVYVPAPVVIEQPVYQAAPLPRAVHSPRVDEAEMQQADVEHYLKLARNGAESARISAIIELGKMKAVTALDFLTATLARDGSPAVREAAARALGLIAAEASLEALQKAALADENPDVRRSASFSAEIIRGQLRRR